MKIVKNLANQIVEKLDAKGVNVLTNTNEVAGQTVHHFHVHIYLDMMKMNLRLNLRIIVIALI